MDVFFSGVESKHALRTIVASKAKNVVLNYAYIKKQKNAEEILIQLKKEGCTIMIDPGSTSLMSIFNWYNTDDFTIQDPDKMELYLRSNHETHLDFIRHEWRKIASYNKRCIDWCTSFNKYLDSVLEMGYCGVVDGTFILQQRKRFRNLPFVPQYTKDTDTYAYVYTTSLGNDATDYTELFNTCKLKGIRVHGKAITRSKLLRALPFFSIDTSAWLYGGQFGTIYKYVGGLKCQRLADTRHSKEEVSNIRAQLKTQVKAEGIDWDAFELGAFEAVNHWNAIQWLHLSSDAATLKASSEYWISHEERVNIIQKKRLGLEKFTKQVNDKELALAQVDPKERKEIALDKRRLIGRMCNTCSIADSCPEWVAGSMCKLTNITAVDNFEDIKQTFGGILSVQRDRLMHKALVERITGIDNESLTNEIESFTRMTKNFNDVINGKRSSIKIEAEGDGVGILGSLLSNLTGNQTTNQRSNVETVVHKQENKKAVMTMKEDTDVIEAEFEEYSDKTSSPEWTEGGE